MSARTDEDAGEPAPARSLPRTADARQSARQPLPHQSLCFAPQFWNSSFGQCLPFKAAISVALDDGPCAESGVLRACAFRLPPHLMRLAWGISEGGTRSHWPVLTAAG